MRLIDAEATKEDALLTSVFRASLGDVRDVEDLIDDAPTIDAVVVVRCRECKHWTPLRNFIEVGNCDRFVSTCTPGSFFCADGKRKMDAEVEG